MSKDLVSQYLHRLISRAVLIHFKEVEPRSTKEQDWHDVHLDEAMASAHGIVALGKIITSGREEFITAILPQVQSALPEAMNRALKSYGLTLFAALKLLVSRNLLSNRHQSYNGLFHLTRLHPMWVDIWSKLTPIPNYFLNSHDPFTCNYKPVQALRQ